MNNTTIEELEKLRQDLLNKASIIEQTIMLYKSMVHSDVVDNISTEAKSLEINNIPNKYSSYKSRYSYKQKIATILTAENRFLSVKEITEIILSLEPQLDFLEVKKGVGSAKSYMIKDKVLVKYVVGTSNTNSFYGSKNWLDENEQPKPEHMYNENALISVKEDIEI